VDVITANSITKRFGELVVLKDFSFHLEAGGCAGVLGINGSGKTTFLKILLNLEGFDAGSFTLMGKEFGKMSQGKLPIDIACKIGYVPQQPSFDEEMEGWDNLRLYGRLYHLPDAKLNELIGNVLQAVHLIPFGDMQVGKYSGGMKKRLAIARALLVQPKLLLLDEPTANLDPQSRNDVWDIIERLNKEQGISVFIATNDLAEAQRLCGEVYLLQNGECAVKGKPVDLIESLDAKVIDLRFSRDGARDLKQIHDQIEAISPDASDRIEGYMHVTLFVPRNSTKDEEIIQMTKSHEIWFETVMVRSPTLEDFFLKRVGVSFEKRDDFSFGSVQRIFDKILLEERS
jgi:ABC-type multidrug transport system ATPase subunit